MQAVEGRRSSGWKDLGLGGLRGGTGVGGGIGVETGATVGDSEKEQSPRNGTEHRSSWSGTGRQRDLDMNGEGGLEYGNEGIDLEEMLDVELNRGEIHDSSETNNEEPVDMEVSSDLVEQSEEIHCDTASEEEESTGMKFLQELDRDYMCSSRMIVRGEYQGMIDGKMYTLIVRRKTEGTLVDWSLYNLGTTRQVLSVKGEMTYPYELTKKTRGPNGQIYGQKVKGGWAWGGWAYGFVNMSMTRIEIGAIEQPLEMIKSIGRSPTQTQTQTAALFLCLIISREH